MPAAVETRPPWALIVSCWKRSQAEFSEESEIGAPLARQAPVPDSQFSLKTVAVSQELAQTFPQAPQLSTLPVRSCSQPLAPLPSQFPKPLAQLGEPQTPPVQIPAPLSKAQEVPSGAAAVWQPLSGSQTPTEQGPVLPQDGAAPGVQTPAWQVSAPLQALPSEQEVPSGAVVIPHAPVDGSHMLATWQASGAAQLVPLPGQEQTSGCRSVTWPWQSSSWGSQSLVL